MVHFLAISLFLLPIVTASGDEFWDDVDMIYNALSDPEDLPTDLENLSTHDAPMPDAPHHSPLSEENDEDPSQRPESATRAFHPKFVTLRTAEVEKFKQELIIEDSENISRTIMEDKLLALGYAHKWFDIHTHEIDKYPKYWAKVCVTFWDKPLVRGHRIACLVSRTYLHNKKRLLLIRQKRLFCDMLICRCHTYISNCRIPLSTPETFLIHKGNKNEFFIFEEYETEGKLYMTGFKDGITLPNPPEFERSKKSGHKFIAKSISLRSHEIDVFNQAISINKSYPQNVTLEELNDKLMELEDINEWPDLLKYNYEKYTKYWAKVCVYFWGKQLNFLYRHSCTVCPSLGDNRIRALYRQDRTQHFDLLYCKCHSYKTTVKIPSSIPDTFLIHQSSANEFFVFRQHETEQSRYTLFIKDFKGGITLPNPDDFN